MAPVIRLSGVSRSFAGERKGAAPVEALKNVTFEAAPGQMIGLIGPDAAGKTTLMRILAGLAQADAGDVEIFGKPVAELDRSRVGYMPQGGALYRELSVARNLDLYARLRGVDPVGQPERLEQLYSLTGLGKFREREAGRLSGGMRQKLAMACAVVAAPPLILLDEPSVGVDPLSRREIWQLLAELLDDGTTVVWATSILDDAARCDDLLVLHEGEVRYSGKPAGLSALAAGRVFELPVPTSAKRKGLARMQQDRNTIDASIEGAGVRVIIRNGNAPGRPLEPRAGDGFAVLLDDGSQLQDSALAAGFPDRSDGIGEGAAIAAVGLTRRFGNFTAAHDISFTVAPGEVFGLLGPNGAGKSTTFRMLCGLLKPTDGSGAVAGRDLRASGPRARKALGYMPQNFSLYGDLTLEANLRFVAGAHAMPRKPAARAIAETAEALSLGPYMTERAALLPLGIRQRLSLAAAVLHKPQVLFLDEPTSGVDPLVRREFWHHINAIAATGVAVLVTTHFMDEAENCDRLLLINHAEAIASGTPAQLKQDIAIGIAMPTLEQTFIGLIESQRHSDVTPA
ncbi:ATP-binding cassette domain-containing protein [Altererythrobacter aquiaggeris]|uniref:ATP-binding cassette domain-containing protein n=1 Tax=Aestuarierythrobacter aquiaggeris TaxID=1898396 RepID=UPI0030198D13